MNGVLLFYELSTLKTHIKLIVVFSISVKLWAKCCHLLSELIVSHPKWIRIDSYILILWKLNGTRSFDLTLISSPGCKTLTIMRFKLIFLVAAYLEISQESFNLCDCFQQVKISGESKNHESNQALILHHYRFSDLLDSTQHPQFDLRLDVFPQWQHTFVSFLYNSNSLCFSPLQNLQRNDSWPLNVILLD